jgi:DHA1 family bicyclomycin/chloramphenicol resistance-like MFS transporter
MRSNRGVLVALGALVALGPLATDAYVPALPELAAALQSDVGVAQLTVTATLLGLGIGQLVAGPWSDRVGRRLPILVGVGSYAFSAAVGALAPTMAVFIASRFLQGLGGAFALVVAYAYVRDRFTGEASVRAFAALLLVAGAGPVIAPLVGGYVAVLAGWRSVFVVLGLVSVAAGIGAAFGLPETRSRTAPEQRERVWATYSLLARDKTFMRIALVNATVFGAMFVYIAASPFVLQQGLGLSVGAYSVVFAVNAFGLVTMAQVSGRLAGRVGAPRLLRFGVAALVVGAVLTAVAATLTAGQLWMMLAGLFILVSSVGMVLPNAATLALEAHAAHSGAASAILGFGQYVLGAVAASLVGVAVIGVPPAAAMSAVIAVLAMTAAALAAGRRRYAAA